MKCSNMKIVCINACVREQSRTWELTQYFLNRLGGEVSIINLEKEYLMPLNRENLAMREQLLREGNLQHEMFRYARQFAEADQIIISAPYWDLAFPALLRTYFEAITVSGITFCYDKGIPRGLCKAGKLVYITTAGGPIFADFGYSYVKTMAQTFYGIAETVCFKAENLDVEGVDVEEILDMTKHEIANFWKNDC